MAYINTNTNQYPVSEQDIRNQYPNISFTVPFQAPEGFAVVFLSPPPAVENLLSQTTREVAPVLTDKGHYEQAWEIVDIYSDFTDAEGVIHTKEEQEAAAVAKEDEIKKQRNKLQAEKLLQETDWTATIDIADPQYSNPYLGNQAEFLSFRSEVRKIAINPPATVETWLEVPKAVWVPV